MKKTKIFFVLLAAIAAPVFVFAATSDNLILPQNTVVDGDYIGAAKRVDISSPVTGDIYVAGGMVNVSNNVGGDIIAAGGNVTVSGNVSGNVRVIGGSVLILGGVARNVSVAGGNITLERSSVVGGSLFAAGGSIEVRGSVVKDVKLAGASVLISGTIGGNTTVYQGGGKNGGLVVLSQAVLSGGLKYTSEKAADIQSGARISGPTVYNKSALSQTAQTAKSNLRTAGKVFIALVWSIMFFAKLILLLIFVLVFKKMSANISDSMISNFWPTLGWGALVFFAVPTAAFILLFTIIGIPFSFLIMAWYVLVTFIAFIFASVAFGKFLCKWLNWKKDSPVWYSVFGFVLLETLTCVGFVGFLVMLLAICWGLGGMILFQKNYIKEWRG